MSERMLFIAHRVSQILGVDHVNESDQIVDHSRY